MGDAELQAGMDQNMSQQLRLVLTADKDELFRIMQEQSDGLLKAALRNPDLDENHLLALLKRRGLPEEIFTAIHAGKRLQDSYKVAFALACHPETPPHLAQSLLHRFYILDLAKICAMPSVPPDLRMAAERGIVQRLPTQPLGTKLTLARRGTAAVVEMLLREGLSQVVEACLVNPHLKEGAVHQFISSFQSTAETISMIARNSRWKGRPNIRLAILKNPRTPAIWFTLFLPELPSIVLRELLCSQRLTAAQKELVREAAGKRRISP